MGLVSLRQSNGASITTETETGTPPAWGEQPVEGNLLLLVFNAYGTASPSTVSIPNLTNAGWTAVSGTPFEYYSTDSSCGIFWKIAGSDETTPPNLTCAKTITWGIYTYEYAATYGWNVAPLDQTAHSATSTTAATSKASGASSTLAQADELVFAFLATDVSTVSSVSFAATEGTAPTTIANPSTENGSLNCAWVETSLSSGVESTASWKTSARACCWIATFKPNLSGGSGPQIVQVGAPVYVDSGTSITPELSSAPSSSNIVVLIVYNDYGIPGAAVATPSGFGAGPSSVDPTTDYLISTFYATGQTAASYTVDFTGSGGYVVAVALEISGASSSSFTDTSGASNVDVTSSPTNVATASVTPSYSNDLALAIWGWNDTDLGTPDIHGAPSGWAVLAGASSGAGVYANFNIITQSLSGTSAVQETQSCSVVGNNPAPAVDTLLWLISAPQATNYDVTTTITSASDVGVPKTISLTKGQVSATVVNQIRGMTKSVSISSASVLLAIKNLSPFVTTSTISMVATPKDISPVISTETASEVTTPKSLTLARQIVSATAAFLQRVLSKLVGIASPTVASSLNNEIGTTVMTSSHTMVVSVKNIISSIVASTIPNILHNVALALGVSAQTESVILSPKELALVIAASTASVVEAIVNLGTQSYNVTVAAITQSVHALQVQVGISVQTATASIISKIVEITTAIRNISASNAVSNIDIGTTVNGSTASVVVTPKSLGIGIYLGSASQIRAAIAGAIAVQTNSAARVFNQTAIATTVRAMTTSLASAGQNVLAVAVAVAASAISIPMNFGYLAQVFAASTSVVTSSLGIVAAIRVAATSVMSVSKAIDIAVRIKSVINAILQTITSLLLPPSTPTIVLPIVMSGATQHIPIVTTGSIAVLPLGMAELQSLTLVAEGITAVLPITLASPTIVLPMTDEDSFR